MNWVACLHQCHGLNLPYQSRSRAATHGGFLESSWETGVLNLQQWGRTRRLSHELRFLQSRFEKITVYSFAFCFILLFFMQEPFKDQVVLYIRGRESQDYLVINQLNYLKKKRLSFNDII